MAEIRELKDNESTIIYPVTTTNAVYLPNGIRTLDNALGEVLEQTSKIVFDGSGNIVKTQNDGSKITTSFLLDGTIKEVVTDEDEKVISTKLYSFKDGEIDITVS